MKLKYVELYGFKSFAEKTKLHFNKEISAIVGPNGLENLILQML